MSTYQKYFYIILGLSSGLLIIFSTLILPPSNFTKFIVNYGNHPLLAILYYCAMVDTYAITDKNRKRILCFEVILTLTIIEVIQLFTPRIFDLIDLTTGIVVPILIWRLDLFLFPLSINELKSNPGKSFEVGI